MNNKKLNLLANEVLSQIELKVETPILSWGFIGGKFDVFEEIEKILNNPPTKLINDMWKELVNEGITIEYIIKNLIDRKLIFMNENEGRTRYAETINLLYLLKQRFSFNDWQTAPKLVSNIKLLPTYRKYPKRNQKWDDVKRILKSNRFIQNFHIKIIEKLIQDISGNYFDLSKFQVDSLQQILNSFRLDYDTATIIGAGTGSGKTKAFYIPAFTKLIETIKFDSSNWLRILSIYPRNELLKDQFKEAIIEAQKLNKYLKKLGLRTILIGAYYGDTPKEAKDVMDINGFYKWNKGENGYICPFMKCPQCDSDLIWRIEDYKNELKNNDNGIYGHYEELHCSKDICKYKITNENIILTRKRMRLTPPDLMFSTTEMLNRKLFDNLDQTAFGIGTKKTPLFLLLDEVHIHNGVQGAHVSYLLRRWRNLIRIYNKNSKVQFIGLSATLTNPKNFFSNLTGLDEKSTTYITPLNDDLVEEGVEYNAVLRGDPMSATALLSTTVQTTMLLSRMLDPLSEDISNGAWGSKLFGFTDKLDVINRWYHIQTDTEDQHSNSQLLSRLRDYQAIRENVNNADQNYFKQLYEMGELWIRADEIQDKCLRRSKNVEITSSQYKGVDSSAEIVIATSTLEVGYNDTRVGAVVQHKSPQDLASFLQRKGRAGRKKGMRPWTIVVTSAYGRDRWAYENPDQLFNPILPELNLPIRNTYVQHIQAAFAVMDWFALKLKQEGNANTNSNIWNILTPKNKGKYQKEKSIIKDLVYKVLSKDNSELKNFMTNALNLDETNIDYVLWTPPRSIILDLLPYIYSTLTVELKDIRNNYLDKNFFKVNTPLLSYIPKNLFSSLDVNDITIKIPEKRDFEDSMGIRQGMAEFAPGNVSKRFANIRYTKSAHWIPIPSEMDYIQLSNNTNIKCKPIGEVKYHNEEMQIFLQQELILSQIPYNINDKSSGILNWNFQMKPNGQSYTHENKGVKINLHKHSILNDIFKSIEVFSFNNNSFIDCTRYSDKVLIETKYRDGNLNKREITFKYNNDDAYIGFKNYVDGIALNFNVPDFRKLMEKEQWNEVLKNSRTKYLLFKLQNNEYLNKVLSTFEIEWLYQIAMSSVIAISISKSETIENSIEFYKNNLIGISERTLSAIFLVNQNGICDEDNNSRSLYKRLLEHINNKDIYEIFLNKLDILYKDIYTEDNFWNWIKDRYISTIASTFKTSIDELLPDLNTDDLIVDIDRNVIWITEPNSGGIGIISKVSSTIRNNPRRFEDTFLNSLNYCKSEELTTLLNTIVSNIKNNEIKNDFYEIRNANTLEEQKKCLVKLQKDLSKLGIIPKKELIIAINTRFLGGNTSEDTDELISYLQDVWKREEKRLNCVIDKRVFSVASIKLKDIQVRIDKILKEVDYNTEIQERQRFSLVESLLWMGCVDSCPECLQLYNYYSKVVEPSRLLLKSILNINDNIVNYDEDDWDIKLENYLKKGEKVKVVSSFKDITKLKQEMLKFTLEPIEFNYELYYPYINKVNLNGHYCSIELCIREVLNE